MLQYQGAEARYTPLSVQLPRRRKQQQAPGTGHLHTHPFGEGRSDFAGKTRCASSWSMGRRTIVGTIWFATGILVGALVVVVASDIHWLRTTLQSAISWSALDSIITLAANVVGGLAAAIGLPMIYFQLKHTENQTRAALGDETPYMDAVERLSRPGEFVVKVVNLNRRAMRVTDAFIEEGGGSCRVEVVDINGAKRPGPEETPYRLPAMLPGWGNRSEEPPWMMIDMVRVIDGNEGKIEIFKTYPATTHCVVVSKPVGKDGMHKFRCRVVSEREIVAMARKIS